MDLSGLEKGFSELLQADAAARGASGSGTPLDLPLAAVAEDPNQPRKAFDQGALEELARSIRADKVRVPISVKPQNAEGRYVINHGGRRYRASLLAGKDSIPAFIDDDHDDYAQVVENIQRDNLTPLEIARFIERRRGAGDKDKVIADRLGKSKSYISFHAALLTWPSYIEAMYEAGHCRDVSTLYNLILLNKRAPREVEAMCKRNMPIARRDVTALEQRLAASQTIQSVSTDERGTSDAGGQRLVNERTPPPGDARSAQTDGEGDTSPLTLEGREVENQFAARQGSIEIPSDFSDAEILNAVKHAIAVSCGKPFVVIPIIKPH